VSNGQAGFELPKNIEHYLAALSRLYAQRGVERKQRIIVNSQVRIHEQWTSDNWNGGTYGHAVFFAVPEGLYLECVDDKNKLQDEIRDDINKIADVRNEFVAEVFFEMQPTNERDWRKASGMFASGQRLVSPETQRRIWDDGCFRVFLSHKAEAKEEAADLKQGLRLFGASCFVAHQDIHPTKEWQDEIEGALFSAHALVALMTQRFHDSDWTDQEVGVAFGRQVPIIALKLGKDPYGFIGKFQALSCSLDDAPEEIARLLITQEQMVDAYVTAVQGCESYKGGNELAKLLPSIQDVSDGQVKALVSAFRTNGQVRNSYGFNGQKPYFYGEGLAFHLNRLTGRDYASQLTGKEHDLRPDDEIPF